MNKKTYFLDTTFITDFVLKRRQEAIDFYKKEKTSIDFISSKYVLIEFKRGPLQHYVYLYNKLEELGDLSKVLLAISQLPIYHHNKLRTIIESLAEFFKDAYYRKPLSEILATQGDITVEQYVVLGCKKELKGRIQNAFRRFSGCIIRITNSPGCYPAKIFPPILEGSIFDNTLEECKGSPNECSLKLFMERNRQVFTDIILCLDQLATLDSELKKYRKTIKKTLKRSIIDFQECRRLGDSLICVEAKSASAEGVVNNNTRHYAPICHIVGIENIPYIQKQR